jgi:hypothetical protein
MRFKRHVRARRPARHTQTINTAALAAANRSARSAGIRALSMNTHGGLDAVFARRASRTATEGHPIALIDQVLLPQGSFAGCAKETLKDFRYFTSDSANDLDRKWRRILSLRPDFIKVMLLSSEEFDKRRADHRDFGQKGLDSGVLPAVVRKAHARVSTDVDGRRLSCRRRGRRRRSRAPAFGHRGERCRAAGRAARHHGRYGIRDRGLVCRCERPTVFRHDDGICGARKCAPEQRRRPPTRVGRNRAQGSSE